MKPDDPVCLCFHVSKRKVVNYCRREDPPVASLISECLSAGTGCGWCVPYLKRLHEQVKAGEADPDLPVDPQTYAKKRLAYRQTGKREDEGVAADESESEKTGSTDCTKAADLPPSL